MKPLKCQICNDRPATITWTRYPNKDRKVGKIVARICENCCPLTSEAAGVGLPGGCTIEYDPDLSL